MRGVELSNSDTLRDGDTWHFAPMSSQPKPIPVWLIGVSVKEIKNFIKSSFHSFYRPKST